MRTLLLLVLLSATVQAQGTRSYQLNDGTVIRAELQDVDKDAGQVRYRFHQGGDVEGVLGRRPGVGARIPGVQLQLAAAHLAIYGRFHDEAGHGASP